MRKQSNSKSKLKRNKLLSESSEKTTPINSVASVTKNVKKNLTLKS
jgi:hypothetical protein